MNATQTTLTLALTAFIGATAVAGTAQAAGNPFAMQSLTSGFMLAAADDKGCRFGHHCCRRTSPNSIKHKVDKHILISTLFY